MLILAFDTATPVASVALLDEDRVLASRYFDIGNQHSPTLFVEMSRLFEVSGRNWGELGAVATTTGPGSFTGLRIGLSAAKGICLARRIQLVGISTLEALAARLPYARLPVWALLDARRGQVYAAPYETKSGYPEVLSEPRTLAPGILVEELAGTEILFTGSGARAYRALLSGLEGAHFAPGQIDNPDAATVGWLGLAKLDRREVLEVDAAEPEYLRTPMFATSNQGPPSGKPGA
ncbi:MAG: tRNA (adenosine(37)-N6)-threonylcarbamoyltransferase complex dimerization subunit type 1 TsaB [Gemmatimonadetes bacterium]|nr:tRNA (adenosine(37)-N6)-threonylcarbamoyltransferase complex dimerization subunit type 1 TsaB [Gemmatimonadota bacterium]